MNIQLLAFTKRTIAVSNLRKYSYKSCNTVDHVSYKIFLNKKRLFLNRNNLFY